jgi:long-subunit acyl-CoA synthetase (AMP-forming)
MELIFQECQDEVLAPGSRKKKEKKEEKRREEKRREEKRREKKRKEEKRREKKRKKKRKADPAPIMFTSNYCWAQPKIQLA